ncbi:sulfite exporter TauE/SafE family protein [Parapedobacter pyrenivorans]|uniref:sulfite exporter TauE/SafE family protein n=1 Tax=Parapedobacter pyrenivorans TaxID=1305674 RepID=UPI003341C357
MSYYTLAFFMGLFGSLHCVAMCGPLVLAFSDGQSHSPWQVVSNKLRYQFGRVMVYGLLGLAIGGIGRVFEIKAWQQGVTLITGVLLVGMGLFTLFGKRFDSFSRLQQQLVGPLTRWIGYWLYRPGGHLVVGMLNGLLPCGMVYMALAAALSADSVGGGGLFMLLFGLGTWPAMLSVSLLGSFAKFRARFNFAFWLPMLCIVMGGWFLLRGANLNIPYLSPLIYPKGAIVCGTLK